MKENLTELVFILDMSGSMYDLTADTVGGFNAMLEKQKREEGEALVSLVVFNEDSTVLLDRVPLDKAEPLTEDQYCPCGSTALLDAMGSAIRHIGNVHKYIREEDRPARTLFVITTDGKENASRSYSADKVRSLVRNHSRKDGWEFLFLGANIDAVETARHYGIRSDRAVEFLNDEQGVELNYRIVAKTISKIRVCPAGAESLDASWKDEIEADRKKRTR